VVNVLRTPQPTPRSAPTLSFESAMLAPTEQTDVSPAPRRRMVLAGLGVVALAGSLLAVRGLRQDPPPAAAPSKPAVVAQRLPAATVAPPAATPVKKALTDSASRARRAARRLRRDSVAKAASASASASDTVPRQVRTAIDGYARAIESKRVDKLKEAYPGLTADQQKGWETGVFAIANAIKASVIYNSVVMHKDGAEVDFTLTLAYDYPGSQGGIPRMKQNAILQEKDGVWQIREIR
jgi:serine/threonine-protein kinase